MMSRFVMWIAKRVIMQLFFAMPMRAVLARIRNITVSGNVVILFTLEF